MCLISSYFVKKQLHMSSHLSKSVFVTEVWRMIEPSNASRTDDEIKHPCHFQHYANLSHNSNGCNHSVLPYQMKSRHPQLTNGTKQPAQASRTAQPTSTLCESNGCLYGIIWNPNNSYWAWIAIKRCVLCVFDCLYCVIWLENRSLALWR